jgi:pimeloyl-ACP methyl ester carboxylesterase
VSGGDPTFVLVTGSGATSFLWNPLVREIALRGRRALPVELPGHGFDTVFPPGYASPQDLEQLAGAASPLAGLSLDDYADHTLGIVRRVAEHGPVVLVGHSLGGSTVTRVANAAPELLARIVYLSAYCCVVSPTVLAYAPTAPAPDSPLGRARRMVFLGNPGLTGASRTNPRDGDPDVIPLSSHLHPHQPRRSHPRPGSGPHDHRSRPAHPVEPVHSAHHRRQPLRPDHPPRAARRHPHHRECRLARPAPRSETAANVEHSWHSNRAGATCRVAARRG